MNKQEKSRNSIYPGAILSKRNRDLAREGNGKNTCYYRLK